MASPLRFFLFVWSLLSALTLAQQAPPACALKCIAAVLSPETCSSITDTVCICTNKAFNAEVAACVTTSCTIPESLVAQNVSLTACGAPVRNRGPQYRVLTDALVTVTAIFMMARLGFKIFVPGAVMGRDDWTAIAAFASAVPSAFITVYGTIPNGLGRDIWTLKPAEITLVFEYFYNLAWLYFVQVTLLKLTLLLFYQRIFPSEGVQKLLWGTMIFNCLLGLAYMITSIFLCWPINYFWLRWDGMHQGKCGNIAQLTVSHAGISIALDFWILGIPMWQLRHLQMHWKKKIGVAVMFCVGTFVTIVSILRLRALVNFSAAINATWEFYDVCIWSTIEICVGVMCACMPTVRMLLVKFFPVLSGSVNRSQQHDRYGTGARLETLNQRGVRTKAGGLRNVTDVENLTASQAGSEVEEGVIRVLNSYEVKTDDEASLVSYEEQARHDKKRSHSESY